MVVDHTPSWLIKWSKMCNSVSDLSLRGGELAGIDAADVVVSSIADLFAEVAGDGGYAFAECLIHTP